MLIIEDIFPDQEVARLRAALEAATFVDGRATAEGTAQEVKRNRQAAPDDEGLRPIRQLVKQTLGASSTIDSYARPTRWSPIIFSRYQPGDAYGEHVDAPFSRADDGSEMRADLSFTVFLSDPASYSGGELVFQTHSRAEGLKPKAGAVVLYATNVLHRVAPLHSGTRLAAVGWIQSRFKSGEERELLYDLEQSIVLLPKDAARRRLTLVFANLMKMWS